LPEMLRLKGVILASMSEGDPRTVEDTLLAAIEVARHQGALAWELRATTTLARERLRHGGSAAPFRRLAALCARFTEGKETPDLRAARDLLERRSTIDGRVAGPPRWPPISNGSDRPPKEPNHRAT